MGLKKSIIAVFKGNLIAQLVTALLGLFFISYLTVEQFSVYTIYQSSIFLLIGLVIVPLNRIMILQSNNSPYATVLHCQMILFIPFILGLIFYFDFKLPIYLASVFSLAFLMLFEYSKSIYQKELEFEKYKQLVATRAFLFAILVIKGFVFLDSKFALQIIIYSQGVSWLIVVAHSLKQDNFSFNKDNFKNFVSVLPEFKYLYIYLLISAVFSQLDIIFLKSITNNLELSTYGTAFQYYMFLNIIMSSVKQVLLPKLQINKNIGFLRLTKRLSPIYVAFSILVVVLMLTSSMWTKLIQNDKYLDAYIVFNVLAFSTIFSMVFSPSSEILQVLKDFKFMAFILSICVICNCFGNYFLAPSYGAVGVAYATLFSFLILNLSFTVRAIYYDSAKNIS